VPLGEDETKQPTPPKLGIRAKHPTSGITKRSIRSERGKSLRGGGRPTSSSANSSKGNAQNPIPNDRLEGKQVSREGQESKRKWSTVSTTNAGRTNIKKLELFRVVSRPVPPEKRRGTGPRKDRRPDTLSRLPGDSYNPGGLSQRKEEYARPPEAG